MPAAPTILLIDDDPEARALATAAIRKALPSVEIDTSVVDDLSFRAVLERDAFHAVVTDYRLQWSDGLKVLDAIRAKYPDVPVVLFTGSGSEEIAVKAFQAGFDDYVVNKPGDVVRLPAAVRRAVARRRAECDR